MRLPRGNSALGWLRVFPTGSFLVVQFNAGLKPFMAYAIVRFTSTRILTVSVWPTLTRSYEPN